MRIISETVLLPLVESAEFFLHIQENEQNPWLKSLSWNSCSVLCISYLITVVLFLAAFSQVVLRAVAPAGGQGAAAVQGRQNVLLRAECSGQRLQRAAQKCDPGLRDQWTDR